MSIPEVIRTDLVICTVNDTQKLYKMICLPHLMTVKKNVETKKKKKKEK